MAPDKAPYPYKDDIELILCTHRNFAQTDDTHLECMTCSEKVFYSFLFLTRHSIFMLDKEAKILF